MIRGLAFVLVVGLLAGCSAGSAGPESASIEAPEPVGTAARSATPTPPDEADEADGADGADEADGADPGSDGTTIDTFVSPLYDAMGFDLGDWPEIEAERGRQVEEVIQRCMAEQGFTYQPRRSSLAPSAESRNELRGSLTYEEFARTHGYGISTLAAADYEGEGVLIFIEQTMGPAPEVARTPAEQQAYDQALTGRPGLDDADDPSDLSGFDEGSCRHQAYSESAPNNPFEEFFTLLGDEYSAMFERLESDPAVVAARESWQTCMAERGHDYQSSEDTNAEIYERLNDLTTALFQHPDTLAVLAQAQQQDLASMPEADRMSFLEASGVLEGFARLPELQAQLDELNAHEIRVATDDWECFEPHQATFLGALGDAEERFVAEHGDQIALIALESPDD